MVDEFSGTKPVKYLRMDNGGENQKLESRLKSADWKLHPIIEYTTRDTSQHNHLAEVAIATIVNKGRTMMIEAKLPEEMKYMLQHKAMETAAKLDGMVIVTIDGQSKPRFEHWSGQLPKFSAHVRNGDDASSRHSKWKKDFEFTKVKNQLCLLTAFLIQKTGQTPTGHPGKGWRSLGRALVK